MNNDTNKVLLLCEIANDFYSKKGKDSMAIVTGLRYASDALTLASKLNYKVGAAKAWMQSGMIRFKQGNNVRAFECFQTALKLAEENGLDDIAADAANKIGYIHCFIMNNPEKSKMYFFKALEFHKRIGDKKYIGRTLVNLGDVSAKQGDWQKGIEYQMEAYKLSSDVKDSAGMAITTGNLGDYYTRTKQFDKAIKFITLSKKIHNLRKSEEGIKYSDGRLGLVYLGMDDLVNAENYLLSGYEYAIAQDNNELLLLTTEPLYNLYKKLKNNEKASYYQLKYFVVRDSVSNLEKLTRITEMENNRALEKLESEREKELAVEAIKRQQENKQRNIIMSFVVLCLVMALIFAIIIFRRFKVSKKQNEIIQQQKEEVELKNELIEEKQKEILDSIHYAKRIQNALLAHKDYIDSHLNDNFVLFKPKDIVSGDFYWAANKGDKFYLASCDSTGHGVPGAFMSLLSIGFLGEAIKEKNILEPNNIFNYVRERLIDSISSEGQKDGFDGILICVDKANKKVTYAAANNAPVVVRDGKLTELACDRMPVGKGELAKSFTLFTYDFEPNDMFYLYTDGYPDQFGGPRGKKFLYKRFNELLLTLSARSIEEQNKLLIDEFNTWKGDLEQIDDVCVIGLRF
jgi:serine phosphatase RsbU (regulator of sigma subunit)